MRPARHPRQPAQPHSERLRKLEAGVSGRTREGDGGGPVSPGGHLYPTPVFLVSAGAGGGSTQGAWAPDSAFVYQARSSSTTIVAAAPTPFGLVLPGTGGTTGANPTGGLVVSPDGAHLYAHGGLSSVPSIFQFSCNVLTGALTALSPSSVAGGSSATPRQVTVSPDGLFLYARLTLSFGDAYDIYSRDPGTGLLTYVSRYTTAASSQGDVGALAISPDGLNAYAHHSNGGALYQMARDPATGLLTALSPGLVSSATGGGSVAVVAPNGLTVFTSGGANSSVQAYERDPSTGLLGTANTYLLAGASSQGVAVTAAHVYVGHTWQMSYTEATDVQPLAPPSPTASVASTAVWMDVSPDGQWLASLTSSDSTIALHRRVV